jgi:hypothetical protein
MKYRMFSLAVVVLGVLLAAGGSIARAQGEIDEPIATSVVTSEGIVWRPHQTYPGLLLTVSGPDGFEYSEEFAAGSLIEFERFGVDKQLRPDGRYTYELRVIPVIDPDVARALQSVSQEERDALVKNLQAAGKLPVRIPAQSGAFLIDDGVIVMGGVDEGSRAPAAPTYFVHPEDVSIQGSLCTGFDCVSGESFGFATLVLKENNLRLKFHDTSGTGSFPSNDWWIEANDSANGGANYFAVRDCGNVGAVSVGVCGGSSLPFLIEAGTPNKALYVDSTGNVGFGSAAPILNLHVVDGDTPALRLEQNNTLGFAAQTWDIAGNETNFFIRDLTGGSRLPFRIKPGAPNNTVYLDSDGDVGIGTASPGSNLHVVGSDGTTNLKIEETNGAAANRNLLTLSNNGGAQFFLTDTSASRTWQIGNTAAGFIVSLTGTGGSEFTIQANGTVLMGPGANTVFTLTPAGALTIAGALTQGSSATVKENFVAVDRRSLLSRVVDLAITTWNYKTDADSVRHLGPTAEDFYAAFGLGADDRHIAPGDLAAIALVAIQELDQIVRDQNIQIEQLKQRNLDLEQRLDALEARLDALAREK